MLLGRVAIIGGAPSSEMLAPFDDKEWDIWVLGNRSDHYPRMDCIFEIHDDRSEHKQPDYDNYLIGLNVPLVVGERFPAQGHGHIRRFPYADAEALLGGLYLTSSPSYMMAVAILEGYKHIGLWGCDMAVDDHEYFYQRPCMEAWIGYAKGLGIEVTIAPQSPVFRSLYVEGRDHGSKPNGGPFTEKQFMVLAEQHSKHIAGLKEQMGAIERQIVAHDGAQQSYARMAAIARAIEGGQDIQQLTDGVRLK